MTTKVGSWLEAKGGIYIPAAAILAVVVATYINMSNQTAVAIDVARQHGDELQLLRQDYTQLHGEMRVILARIDSASDDRFRGRDAQAMEERLIERIRRLESKVDKYHD